MSDDVKTVSSQPARSLRAWLRRPPKWSMLSVLIVGLLGGILIWGGLNTGMEYTNRTEFCTSCHEMTDRKSVV